MDESLSNYILIATDEFTVPPTNNKTKHRQTVQCMNNDFSPIIVWSDINMFTKVHKHVDNNYREKSVDQN